jgi:hypothetical protein
MISAKANPRSTSPPKINSVNKTSNVVTEVTIVRESVALIERFTSQVVTLRLEDVRVLADAVEHHHRVVKRVPDDRQQRRDDRLVDLVSENGRMWCSIEKMPSVIVTSCASAATAPSGKATLSSRKGRIWPKRSVM